MRVSSENCQKNILRKNPWVFSQTEPAQFTASSKEKLNNKYKSMLYR